MHLEIITIPLFSMMEHQEHCAEDLLALQEMRVEMGCSKDLEVSV